MIRSRWYGILLACLLLAACGNDKIPVSVHGVNYSGDAFSYALMDTQDPPKPKAGELIDEYGAGGIVCCYDLPRKWRPGLRLTLSVREDRLDEAGKDVDKDLTVDVPKYEDGKPGEVWVQRFSDATYALVLSDYQPNHPNWPGRIKGWPVPSLDYQRKRWDIEIRSEEGYFDSYRKSLELLDSEPDEEAQRDWDFRVSQFENLKKFSGPKDAKFLEMIRKENLEGLKESTARLQKLKEERP